MGIDGYDRTGRGRDCVRTCNHWYPFAFDLCTLEVISARVMSYFFRSLTELAAYNWKHRPSVLLIYFNPALEEFFSFIECYQLMKWLVCLKVFSQAKGHLLEWHYISHYSNVYISKSAGAYDFVSKSVWLSSTAIC